jgi:hypothetical protein
MANDICQSQKDFRDQIQALYVPIQGCANWKRTHYKTNLAFQGITMGAIIMDASRRLYTLYCAKFVGWTQNPTGPASTPPQQPYCGGIEWMCRLSARSSGQ